MLELLIEHNLITHIGHEHYFQTQVTIQKSPETLKKIIESLKTELDPIKKPYSKIDI